MIEQKLRQALITNAEQDFNNKMCTTNMKNYKQGTNNQEK